MTARRTPAILVVLLAALAPCDALAEVAPGEAEPAGAEPVVAAPGEADSAGAESAGAVADPAEPVEAEPVVAEPEEAAPEEDSSPATTTTASTPTSTSTPAPAPAATRRRRTTFEWMPGSGVLIPHTLGASYDTPGFNIQVTPYTAINAGGDLAFFALSIREAVTLRFALFGIIEIGSIEPFGAGSGFVGPMPVADWGLWRGVNGVSLALSLDSFARRYLPPLGAFEVVVSYRHESDHFTGPGDLPREFVGVPNIGDFIAPEVAIFIPVGPVDLLFRVQLKLFVDDDRYRGYTYGPGADAIARWRALRWGHPFLSMFFEYLFGGQRDDASAVPDNYVFRTLLGMIFPGRRYADFQLFASLAVGHGKGLHAFQEGVLIGGGLRIVVPSVTIGDRPAQFRTRREREALAAGARP